jgi:N6-L-threonylcarbamoyladenine synthase
MEAINNYKVIATTLDDSIGEAFDKVSRMLELDWVGENCQEARLSAGAALELLAKQADSEPQAFSVKFPVPLSAGQGRKSLAFSFSGLKTSVQSFIEKQKVERNGSLDSQLKAQIAASFQQAAIEHLCQKIEHSVSFLASNSKGIDIFQMD